jgi:hypothetical protein
MPTTGIILNFPSLLPPQLVGHFRNDATRLPPDIREAVRSSHYDYNIFQVQEVEMPLHPVNYFIHLEGKTKLINLRIYDGEIEELQKFDKSK